MPVSTPRAGRKQAGAGAASQPSAARPGHCKQRPVKTCSDNSAPHEKPRSAGGLSARIEMNYKSVSYQIENYALIVRGVRAVSSDYPDLSECHRIDSEIPEPFSRRDTGTMGAILMP